MDLRNVVLFVFFLASGMIGALPGVLSPFWASTFGLNASTLGVIISLEFVANLAGVLTAGWWSDRLGKLRLIRWGGAVLGAGSLLVGLSPLVGTGPGLAALVVGLAVSGWGTAVLVVTVNAYCADVNQPQPARALGLLNFFWALGAMASPALVMVLGTARQFWTPFAIVVACVVAVALALGLTDPAPRRSLTARPRFTSGRRVLFAVGLLAFLYAGVEGGLSTWGPLYWNLSGLARSPWAGLLLPGATTALAFWGFLTAGRLLYSRWAPRRDVTPFLFAASLVLTLLAAVWFVAGPGPWVALAFALLGLVCAGVFPALVTTVSTRFPDQTGAAGSLLILSVGAGSVFWPVVTGWGFDHVGISWFPLLVAVVTGIMAVTTVVAMPRQTAVP